MNTVLRALRRGGVSPLWTRMLLLCLYGSFAYPRIWCLDRDRSLTQFYHTNWTVKDGAPSQISTLAQTADGYLWIGSQRGLFRFDGVQFSLYEPASAVRFPSDNINSLMATPDGGLWISFSPSGVGFLKEGQFALVGEPSLEVYTFARDLDGTIWAGTRTGLLSLDGREWIESAGKWNFTGHRVWAMFVDRSGTLWVAADNTLFFLPRASKSFQQTGVSLDGVPRIAEASDGRLWLSQWDRPLRAIRQGGQNLKGPIVQVEATKFLFVRDGSLWMVGHLNGVCRLRFPERLGDRTVKPRDPELEWFTERQGLTSNAVNNVLEDREGNIWVSSNKGLTRFRSTHLVPVRLPSNHGDSILLAGENGDLWVGSSSRSPILHIHGDKMSSATPPGRIASVYRESERTVWWGGHGGIWHQQDDRFKFYPQPARLSRDWVWELFPDDRDGGLWVGLGDFGLVHFKDGSWTFPPKPKGLPDVVPSASFHDGKGRTWLGYTGNRVVVLDRGGVQGYSQADGIDIGRIRVMRAHGSQMFFGGEHGLAVLAQGRFTTIRTAEARSLGAVTGIVESLDGALWLTAEPGIVRISPSDVLQLAKDPNHVVLPTIYDYRDGLPGAPQIEFRSSTAVRASDNRLWFATDNGLAWINPVHDVTNNVPPPVVITALDTQSNRFALPGTPRLPQRTTSLRIEYTALSLSIPERVRFRYKLQAVDKDWHDAGTRHEAAYNNLSPGQYEFRVMAANDDGLWNEKGSAVTFTIAPAWFQTMWFRLVCAAAVGLGVWVMYQFHRRQIERQFAIALDARVQERTRIARELHDSLLQSFQGLMFRLQAVRDLLPGRPGEAIEAFDIALERGDRAIAEGRETVSDLRESIVGDKDVAKALTALGEELAAQSDSVTGPRVSVLVQGKPRDLDPLLRDEIYQIAREALRNAFHHSKAQKIEVEIMYGDSEFLLHVRDDGSGMAPEIAKRGARGGHWGLTGMRERAKTFGGKLEVWSQDGAGTEIELMVPASAAYAIPQARRRFWSLRKVGVNG